MRQYNIFQPLFRAFYSQSLYQDVGRNWRGIGALYLLLLSVLCSVPFMLYVHHEVKQGLTKVGPYIDQMPTLTLAKGKLSIDGPQPYFIKDPKTNAVLVIIDTTGKITSLNKDEEASVLLTQDQMITQDEQGIQSKSLAMLPDGVYTQQTTWHHLHELANILLLAAYPIVLILFFLIGILQALIYSAVIALFIHTSLEYKTLFRLAVVALTPEFILGALRTLFHIDVPYRWVIFILLSIGYLIFALRANWKIVEAKN